MKLVAYRAAGSEHLGVLDAEQETLYKVDGVGADPSSVLLDQITDWAPAKLAELQRSGEGIPVSEVKLLAPLPRLTRNIFCIGKNYYEHSAELARSGFDGSSHTEVPGAPVFFTKPPSSVIGPDDPINAHRGVTNAIDYEVELAVIIGKAGFGIRAQDAWDHIWGYTMVNDVTARDLQRDHTQWFRGKALDTFCPMGPWAVSADEVDAMNLTLECRVNGELRQSANTKDLIFKIPDLIATLSDGIGLRPGDVIATGTPAGVGLGFDPPKFLAPGDEVSARITGLGTLTNTLADSAPPQSADLHTS